MRRAVHYDDEARFFLLLLLIAQFFFLNGIYLFIGGICFGAIAYSLMQPYKPTVFTIIFVYHFIQVIAGIWLSNFLGEDINYRSPNSTMAVIISFIGLSVMFMPIIYYQSKIPAFSLVTLKSHANKLSIIKTFQAYVVGFFVFNAIGGIALSVQGFAQILVSLVSVKWFLYLLFGLQVFLKRKMIKEFIFFTGFEFITGFYSYFSDFKTVIFFLLFLCLVFMATINLKHLILASASAVLIFYGMAYYQSIKGEYRQFLNQGSRSQNVSVSKDEALNKLMELADEQKPNNIDNSIESFLDRFQYTYHLAKAMEVVPAKIPYQEGANWGETLKYSLTPRLLNPDKASYDASIKTSRYTGIPYSGAAQGVSVSLGYFADSYVDFGIVFMLIPIFLIGLIYGKTYYYFVRKSSTNLIFNYSVVGALYMGFFAFEMDSTYLAGRLFATLVTFYLLKLFFFPWLMKYLTASEEPAVKKIKLAV